MPPERLAPPPDFVTLGPADGLLVDLRYASRRNFTGQPVPGAPETLILHPTAARKLRRAVALLGARRADLRLLVLDGLRPLRVQRAFWALVHGTPWEPYVADPALGSMHAFGLAVDVTLADAHGVELDMGSRFDDFSPLSEPRREAEFLAAGALTPLQIAHRRLLRGVMEVAGFQPLPIEWWHFDAMPPDEARALFTPVG